MGLKKYLDREKYEEVCHCETNLNKVSEIVKEREEKAFKYDCLINKIQNKLDYIENMLKRTAKGELQRYTPSELIMMRSIYNEILEEEV